MQVRKSDLKEVVKEVLNEEGMLSEYPLAKKGNLKKQLAALNGHILEFTKQYPMLPVSKSLKRIQEQLRTAYKDQKLK